MGKTKKTAKELAKEYYPTYWDINRLVNLVENDKVDFTAEDYNEITGFVYPVTE
ncbi:MAG: XkdX family protein [Eubacterium sp.]|nr:XkdX family protein [Eubacterium sp.]